MEMLTVLYLGKHESEEKRQEAVDERKRALAEKAWELFHDWSRIPGTQDDGSIDETELEAWIKEVREKAAAADRIAVADLTIGNVFAHSPIDPDGN